MAAGTQKPVLLVGGSGVIGSRAAKALRRFHPGLPIAIGGRDVGRAAAVAEAVGGAEAVGVDTGRPGLGLPEGKAYGAVVMFVRDEGLRALKYAQAAGVPYVDISTGAFEMAPLVAQYVSKPAGAPVALAAHWLAGAATLPALHFAKEFRSVDSIEVGAIFDEEDIGGPAALSDYERYMKVGSSPLLLKDGAWLWPDKEGATRAFTDSAGATFEGQAYATLDIFSLAAATSARSVRFDGAMRPAANRRRGEPFSIEIVVEIAGERAGGAGRVRHELIHPEGQAPLTSLGAALVTERLLGLAGGAKVSPGLYLPEVLIEPEYMMRRLAEFGTQIRKA